MTRPRNKSIRWRARNRLGLWANVPWWLKGVLHFGLIFVLFRGVASTMSFISSSAASLAVVPPPLLPAPAVPAPTTTLEIQIETGGMVSVGGTNMLVTALPPILVQHTNSAITLMCSPASTHQDLMTVFDECTRHGIKNVNVLSK